MDMSSLNTSMVPRRRGSRDVWDVINELHGVANNSDVLSPKVVHDLVHELYDKLRDF